MVKRYPWKRNCCDMCHIHGADFQYCNIDFCSSEECKDKIRLIIEGKITFAGTGVPGAGPGQAREQEV